MLLLFKLFKLFKFNLGQGSDPHGATARRCSGHTKPFPDLSWPLVSQLGFQSKRFWRKKDSEEPSSCSTAELGWHRHFWGKTRGNWADFPVLVTKESVHMEGTWWDQAALKKISSYLILIAQCWFWRAGRGRAGENP